MKWSRFGLITAGSSKTLFLCYAAGTHITAQSFQEKARRRFESAELKSTASIELKKMCLLIFFNVGKTYVPSQANGGPSVRFYPLTLIVRRWEAK